jgi:hypothetical protein
MKSLYEDLPPVEIAGRKLVGRVLFGLLVLISALVGATAGLLSRPWKHIVRVRLQSCMTTTGA